MKRARLTQLDEGLSVPNMALMRASHALKDRGWEVTFSTSPFRGMFEPDYDLVLGSAIFSRSLPSVETLLRQFPGAVVGGTGLGDDEETNRKTIEAVLGLRGDYERLDYSIYPDFTASLGFTQRGCRLRCGHCVVWRKEGHARATGTVHNIWRGDGHPKTVHILDNDFFGQPVREWEKRVDELVSGGFKACLNQGVNLRKLTDYEAQALVVMPLYDDQFQRRRIYTAWDEHTHERSFFRGVERFVHAGGNPRNLFVYMLVGYGKDETWATVFRRWNKMVAEGMRPYPMPFNEDKGKKLPLGGHNAPVGHLTLGDFQRWAIRSSKLGVPFAEYDKNAKGRKSDRQANLFGIVA